MASPNESSLNLSWPGLVALLAAALGLIVSRPSIIQSPRPTTTGGDRGRVASKNSVPARLWQDPLTAAQRGQQSKGDISSIVKPYREKTNKQEKVLFLFDCIDPENALEAAETRRRERYAILSALSTAGYTPTHPDRIYTAAIPGEVPENISAAKNAQGGQASNPRPEDAMLIPYEWVQRDERDDIENSPYYQAVCVLWVSPFPDSKKQLRFLAYLKDLLKEALLTSKGCPKPDFAIAGRIGSTQLADILQEKTSFAEPITMYITNSTAPFVRRMQPQACGLNLEYVIDTDRVLAKTLIEELKYRHIKLGKGDGLAIIAEWDTDYGREMHEVFKDAIVEDVFPDLFKDATLCQIVRHYPSMDATLSKIVRHYSYLRGLDGKELGGASGGPKGASAEDGNSDPNGAPKPSPAKPTAKEGEGDPQIDYLRRLAQLMKADAFPYKAIGIVGSDVYDKLLLLKALRPVFPDAVFFTTDLDVRLLQAGDYSDTRNLLIASHFGLSLNKDLQGTVAPFRSSYDTASYLGCLRAVKYRPVQTNRDASTDVLKLASPADQRKLYPRIYVANPNGDLLVPKLKNDKRMAGMPVHLYEVGRNGSYELTLREDDPLESPNPRLQPALMKNGNLACLIGIALIAVLLMYPLSRPCQRFVGLAAERGSALFARLRRRKAHTDPTPRERNHAFLWVGVVLAAGLALLMAILYAHTHENEESFELFEGISVWPTVVLRLVASGLCVYYIATALQALEKRNENCRATYSLGGAEEAYPGSGFRGVWLGLQKSCQAWTRESPKDGHVRALCQVFAEHGVPWQRAFRSGLLAALNLALFVLLWQLFDPTMTQARGSVAFICYLVVLVLTLLTLAGLLMFVADSTLLSYRFVTALAGQYERKWPATLLTDAARTWGLPVPVAVEGEVVEVGEVPRAVGQWLSIRLIDDVTNVVAGRLIYYPFVVLMVLVVAQNRLFDNWHWNTPLVLMAIFSAGVAVVSAVLLQSAARSARDRALRDLDELLRARVGPAEDAVREKLARIRSEIEGVNTGAFAGLSQNPVVGAVLLPLGGGGGLAALEALLSYLANP